jgi:arsenite methyltransferase
LAAIFERMRVRSGKLMNATESVAGLAATEPTATETMKSCCAQLYESDYAKLLLGDSFHPGGMALTERLGQILGLGPGKRLLDVASGKGTSLLHLAEKFGCEAVGIDYGGENVRDGNARAAEKGLSGRVSFVQGDAERLPFDDASFDAVICECAYCTFPDKSRAASEFSRVLRPGGRVGLSDLTRNGPLDSGLESLLAWIACIADAQPVNAYATFLQNAGFRADVIEPHDDALTDLVNQIRLKLMGAEIMVALKKIELPNVDFVKAKQMATDASESIRQGRLGYAIISAVKP